MARSAYSLISNHQSTSGAGMFKITLYTSSLDIRICLYRQQQQLRCDRALSWSDRGSSGPRSPHPVIPEYLATRSGVDYEATSQNFHLYTATTRRERSREGRDPPRSACTGSSGLGGETLHDRLSRGCRSLWDTYDRLRRGPLRLALRIH